MLVSSGSQLSIGSMIECEQRVVGAWHGQKDLIELALRRSLMPGLGVLDDKDHREGDRGHQGLEDGLPPGAKSGHDADRDSHPAPPMTSTTASGLDACRSARDSHRLRWERPAGRPALSTESPLNP